MDPLPTCLSPPASLYADRSLWHNKDLILGYKDLKIRFQHPPQALFSVPPVHIPMFSPCRTPWPFLDLLGLSHFCDFESAVLLLWNVLPSLFSLKNSYSFFKTPGSLAPLFETFHGLPRMKRFGLCVACFSFTDRHTIFQFVSPECPAECG